MTTRPHGPAEPPDSAGGDGQRAAISRLWPLVLDRFRDYLHWTGKPATDCAEENE